MKKKIKLEIDLVKRIIDNLMDKELKNLLLSKINKKTSKLELDISNLDEETDEIEQSNKYFNIY